MFARLILFSEDRAKSEQDASETGETAKNRKEKAISCINLTPFVRLFLSHTNGLREILRLTVPTTTPFYIYTKHTQTPKKTDSLIVGLYINSNFVRKYR